MLPLERQINVIGFSRMLILYGSAVVFEIVVEEVYSYILFHLTRYKRKFDGHSTDYFSTIYTRLV